MSSSISRVVEHDSHIAFVTGLTGDEFYTDGGMKLNRIEELIEMELKQNGFERIVFYDQYLKLYCYDDDSYALLLNGGQGRRSLVRSSTVRPKSGLGMGKHVKMGTPGKENSQSESAMNQNGDTDDQAVWIPGPHSGINIRNYGRSRLHLGEKNQETVLHEIMALMENTEIRTAVVINDMSAFLKEYGHVPSHFFTAEIQRLSAENKNLMVCIYTESNTASAYPTEQLKDTCKVENSLQVCSPNAAELRNMLMYFHVNMGLKFRLSELDHLALCLRQAIAAAENMEKKIRIGTLYRKLEAFDKSRFFTENSCYEICGAKKPDDARKQLDQLIGLKSIKEMISSYASNDEPKESVYDYLTSSRIREDRERPKRHEMIHFVLTGNPGTGKTTVANLIGQIFFEMGILSHGRTKKCTRADLVAEYVGQTAVKTQRVIDEAVGGVLFIDEAYTLKRSADTGNDFGQEAIDVIMEQMSSRTDLVVIAAGYPEEMEIFLHSNPGLASRFIRLHIDDYTPKEMVEIVKLQARKNNAVLSEEMSARLPDFCENWVNLAGQAWGNAREAEKLIANMIREWNSDSKRKKDEKQQMVLELRYLPDDLREYLKPVAELRDEVLKQLNSMTGLREVKATIEKLRLRMVAGDITEPGHYIFTGNPGTGKTTVAGYMGRILRNLGLLSRGHMVSYTATELMSRVGYNGSFEDAAKEAFNGVLFIDEAYQLVDDNRGIGSRIIASMLSFMENPEYRRKISIIVAGYEDEMDDFIKQNPGFKSRFSAKVHFENYTGEELHTILLSMLKERGITPDDEFKELSLRALTKYVEIHGKERDFGNARYIRMDFLPAAIDAQNARLIGEYGEDFPRELKKILTGKDIPADLVRYTKAPIKQKKTESEASPMEEIEQLIGFDEVKKKLRGLLALKEAADKYDKPELLENMNMHWILRGNPGTGKTTVAKLVGRVYKEMGLLANGRTRKVTRKDLVGEYVGHTAPKTQKEIDRAMGGVLFIDEAYTLKRQDAHGDSFGQEAIDTLLEQMSDKNGEFAVIAAGYPREMQVFLDSNPGFASRFDQDFVLRDYTADELLQIFEMKCRKSRFQIDEETRNTLKRVFGNMIAARIRNWANGREAENLERKMKEMWALNPVIRRDEATGEDRSYYTIDHLPEYARPYLIDAEQRLQEQEKQREEQKKNGYKIPRNVLADPIKDYNFDDNYAQQDRSVVFIKVESPEGSGSGSGSIISTNGHVLTCHHVISGSTDIQVRLKVEKDGGWVSTWEKAETVWADPELDMAILKLPGSGYPALALREHGSDTVKNEPICINGYPFGEKISDAVDELDSTLFHGTVASIQTYRGMKRIMCNVEAKRGDSGAPVFSKKDGTIIGILCGSHTEGDEKLTEEIQYVRPVQYIWDYVISSDR